MRPPFFSRTPPDSCQGVRYFSAAKGSAREFGTVPRYIASRFVKTAAIYVLQYCMEKNIGGAFLSAFLRAFLRAFLAFLRLFS